MYISDRVIGSRKPFKPAMPPKRLGRCQVSAPEGEGGLKGYLMGVFSALAEKGILSKAEKIEIDREGNDYTIKVRYIRVELSVFQDFQGGYVAYLSPVYGREEIDDVPINFGIAGFGDTPGDAIERLRESLADYFVKLRRAVDNARDYLIDYAFELHDLISDALDSTFEAMMDGIELLNAQELLPGGTVPGTEGD